MEKDSGSGLDFPYLQIMQRSSNTHDDPKWGNSTIPRLDKAWKSAILLSLHEYDLTHAADCQCHVRADLDESTCVAKGADLQAVDVLVDHSRQPETDSPLCTILCHYSPWTVDANGCVSTRLFDGFKASSVWHSSASSVDKKYPATITCDSRGHR